MPFSLFSLLRLLAVVIPAYLAFDAVSPRFRRFDPAELQRISQRAIGVHGSENTEAVMRAMVADLKDAYPGLINDYDPSRWVFNVAGGATGAMLILHSSITEYLIFFGSAVGTEGHSGIHTADDYFTIISGTQLAEFLGELHPRVYKPGDQHYHPRGSSAHYRLDQSSWALELAQGFIPGMLPFGLIQMPLSLDWDSLVRTVWYTGQDTVRHLLHGKI